MDTLVKADIFFFIASIALVLVTIAILIAVYYIILIIKRVEEFTRVVEKHLENAKGEVSDIKDDIKESFVYNLIFGKKAKKKHH